MRVVIRSCDAERHGGLARRLPVITVAAMHDSAVVAYSDEPFANSGYVGQGLPGCAVGSP